MELSHLLQNACLFLHFYLYPNDCWDSGRQSSGRIPILDGFLFYWSKGNAL